MRLAVRRITLTKSAAGDEVPAGPMPQVEARTSMRKYAGVGLYPSAVRRRGCSRNNSKRTRDGEVIAVGDPSCARHERPACNNSKRMQSASRGGGPAEARWGRPSRMLDKWEALRVHHRRPPAIDNNAAENALRRWRSAQIGYFAAPNGVPHRRGPLLSHRHLSPGGPFAYLRDVLSRIATPTSRSVSSCPTIGGPHARRLLSPTESPQIETPSPTSTMPPTTANVLHRTLTEPAGGSCADPVRIGELLTESDVDCVPTARR